MHKMNINFKKMFYLRFVVSLEKDKHRNPLYTTRMVYIYNIKLNRRNQENENIYMQHPFCTNKMNMRPHHVLFQNRNKHDLESKDMDRYKDCKDKKR